MAAAGLVDEDDAKRCSVGTTAGIGPTGRLEKDPFTLRLICAEGLVDEDDAKRCSSGTTAGIGPTGRLEKVPFTLRLISRALHFRCWTICCGRIAMAGSSMVLGFFDSLVQTTLTRTSERVHLA